MAKRYKLSADQITRLIPPMGGCIATDKIVVDGNPVDFMSRTKPNNPQDSGWLFMRGGETQAYMDDARNLAVYDVNTIANYDREIVPFLTYPIGSEIERGLDGQLHVVRGSPEPERKLLAAVTPASYQQAQTFLHSVTPRTH